MSLVNTRTDSSVKTVRHSMSSSVRNTGTQSDLVVVTGVSPGGLGTEVVRSIAPYANLIYVTGRNKDRYAMLS